MRIISETSFTSKAVYIVFGIFNDQTDRFISFKSINDAPALAAANVSVAMSDASDIARETADITLCSSNLEKLALFRSLSERLMERINKNYRMIIGINTTLLAFGFFGVITPTTSAFLHNASTMAICAKSMLPLLDDDK